MPVLREAGRIDPRNGGNFVARRESSQPPARRIAILTCIDAPIDPPNYAGDSEVYVHVIRNPTGRASDDAIRSLCLSHELLGINEYLVVHHSHCAMVPFSDDGVAGLLDPRPDTSTTDAVESQEGRQSGRSSGDRYARWLTIEDPRKALLADVARIRRHPSVACHIPIYGYIYDARTCTLIEVPEATLAGRPATH